MKAKIIFVSILIILGILSMFSYNKYSYYVLREAMNPNHVKIINKSNLDSKLFKITWTHHNSRQLTLFENEKYLNPKFKEYGKNLFKVWYKDSLITSFHQFKFNNWHGHTYSFTIQSNNKIKLDVQGPDQRVYKSHRDQKIN